MKIILADVLNASKALKELMEVRYTNFNVTHALVNLSQFMDKEITFYLDQSKKLSGENYSEELTKLLNTVIEMDDNLVVNISADDFVDNKNYPTPMNVLALSKFVIFK